MRHVVHIGKLPARQQMLKGPVRSVSALLFFLLSGPDAPSAAERRCALVVGNSSYEYMSNRANAKADAVDAEAALEKLGFQVTAAFDLDKAKFEATIGDFAKALTGSAVALFFYAGHGVEVSGRNYLLAIDAQLAPASARKQALIPLETILLSMQGAAKIKLVFLDTDRNEPPMSGTLVPDGSAREQSRFAHDAGGVGTLISFSTQPGGVARDGEGRNTPFTAALLKRLPIPGADLQAILDGVRGDVMGATHHAQVPWYHSSLQEKFYFNYAAAK